MRNYVILLLSFVLGPTLYAQKVVMVRQMHQSFPISEATKEIRFEMTERALHIAEEGQDTLWFRTHYALEPWAGNTLLVETTVTLTHGRSELLDFFIKDGRYSVLFDSTSASPMLHEMNPKRKLIKTKEGTCGEEIRFRIFVPDVFAWDGPQAKSAVRKEEDE